MTSGDFTPRVFIVLPVHNRREITSRFATALAAQTWTEFELILVDDGSTDGTAEAVVALWPRTEVVRGDGGWWWAGSLDQGCRRVESRGARPDDVLLLINDDVAIAPDFLARACAELAAAPATLLLARQVDAASGAELDHGGGVAADLRELRFRAASRPEEINCLPTRGLLMRWKDFQATGGFRPRELPHYLSDYEFTLRARARGLRLQLATNASVRVHVGETGRSLHTLDALPRRARLALLFSPRFKDNPITWSRFAALAARPARRPYLYAKIWLHFLVIVARCVCRTVRPEQRLSAKSFSG